MSKQSEYVKLWRKRTKERIIESMGGSCCVCGYNKCQRTLCLHHLDPSKKDFDLSSIRSNPISWPLIVEELRKCILLCSNCHFEIHDGMTQIPACHAVFDESFADYRELQRKIKEKETELSQNFCSVCKILKPIANKYCSNVCSSRANYRVDWDKIDLESLYKEKPVTKIAEELGISDGAIHKRLKKMGLKTSLKTRNKPIVKFKIKKRKQS